MKKIIIIGGGASGVFAAITLKSLSEQPIEVIILEKQSRIGKKILSTGNGKCNLSNTDLNEKYYNTPFVGHALELFSTDVCRNFFYNLGLLTRIEDNRIYPYSEKASSVVDVLLRKLEELQIEVKLNYDVTHVRKTDNFIVYANDYRFETADYVMLATGGQAQVNFVNTGYKIASYLGHHSTNLRPGLVALKTKENLKSLAGIRLKCQASLIEDGKIVAQSCGEVLFKDKGLSGIAIFDISRRFRNKGIVELNLVDNLDDNAVIAFLERDSYDIQLKGILPKMVAEDIIKRCDKQNIHTILHHLRHYRFTIIDTYGYDQAQVTIGGIDVRDINPLTYASLKTKGLYILGEMLNVDAVCGGYNLHFAWASGYLAAQDIISKIKQGEINEFTE